MTITRKAISEAIAEELGKAERLARDKARASGLPIDEIDEELRRQYEARSSRLAGSARQRVAEQRERDAEVFLRERAGRARHQAETAESLLGDASTVDERPIAQPSNAAAGDAWRCLVYGDAVDGQIRDLVKTEVATLLDKEPGASDKAISDVVAFIVHDCLIHVERRAHLREVEVVCRKAK